MNIVQIEITLYSWDLMEQTIILEGIEIYCALAWQKSEHIL